MLKAAEKLKIGFSLGDLGGIGPEIFSKFKSQLAPSLEDRVEIILIDDENEVNALSRKIKVGQASAESGEHCFKTLVKASEMANKSEIDFLVTGPVAKESLWLAGYEFTGQTELLANINGLSRHDIEMFFILNDLRFALATRHLALKEVSEELKLRLDRVIKNSLSGLKDIFQIDEPRLAICSLNPHAGENGIIGSEEIDFIKPIIEAYQAQGHKVEGPLAADYILAQSAQKYIQNLKQDFDLYIAAYHDQALPVIKGLGGYKAINLTVGLPFIRMSVDHGTGFDIAGKGIAKPEGLNACANFCLKLADLKNKAKTRS